MSKKRITFTVEVGGRTKLGRALKRLALANIAVESNAFDESIADVGHLLLSAAYRAGWRYEFKRPREKIKVPRRVKWWTNRRDK